MLSEVFVYRGITPRQSKEDRMGGLGTPVPRYHVKGMAKTKIMCIKKSPHLVNKMRAFFKTTPRHAVRHFYVTTKISEPLKNKSGFQGESQ